MELINIISISIDGLLLVILGWVIRAHMMKLQKMEDKVDLTLSQHDIRSLIDLRIDEKQILLDYRLKELTNAVDKLTLKLEKLK